MRLRIKSSKPFVVVLCGLIPYVGCGVKNGEGSSDSATDTEEEEPGAWIHGYWVEYNKTAIWTMDFRPDGRAEFLRQTTCHTNQLETTHVLVQWEIVDQDTVRIWREGGPDHHVERMADPQKIRGVARHSDLEIGILRRREETICLGYHNFERECGLATFDLEPCPLPSLLDEEED